MKTKTRTAIGLTVLLLTLAGFARGAGVTVITHGFQLFNNFPDWVPVMENAVARQIKKGDFVNDELTTKTIRVHEGTPLSVDTLISIPANSRSGEILVVIDWSDVSSDTHDTREVAQAVLPFLMNSQNSLPPLSELPIHLIGHSRGGSLICEIARLLGQQGIWIEQLTTLDPHPETIFVPDAPANIYSNVLFADNYWQDDRYDNDPNGQRVEGAYNRFLADAVLTTGGYSGTFGEHSDIHHWYHGTIDLTTPLSYVDSGDTIMITEQMRQTWWTAAEDRGSDTGFHFSRLAGGTMNGGTRNSVLDGQAVATGLRVAQAHRTPLSVSSTDPNVWDDIEIVDFVNDLTVTPGATFEVHVYYEDLNRDATIEFGLDNDANPYNGVYRSLSAFETRFRPATEAYLAKFLNTSAVAEGTYYPYAKISNGNHTRYFYAQGKLIVNPALPMPGAPTVNIVSPADGSTLASDLIQFNGTASGDAAVAQVSWINEATGQSGIAAGTTTWTASVGLALGANRVTVTAKDANGRTGTASITVYYDTSLLQVGVAATQFTWVSSASANHPFGSGAPMWVGFDPGNPEGGNERGFVKFNLSSIPEGSTVVGARLRLLVRDCEPTSPPNLSVNCYRVTANWSDGSLSWNSQPGFTVDNASSTTVFGCSRSQTYEWDVSVIVSGWIAGAYANQGFVLVSSAENSGTQNDRNFQPVTLVIDYRPERIAPTIAITSPTTQPSFTTSTSPINLSGSASDNVRVSSVTWANTVTGQTGPANGTTSWSASLPLAPGTNQITVAAHDPAGNSGTAAITVIYDATPPSVPTNVTATAISSSQIYVTWSESLDTGGSGIQGYKVYRDGLLIANVPALSYADGGLGGNTTYCYTVAACDNAGNPSSQSSQTCAMTQPTGPNMLPNMPSNLAPSDGAIDQPLTLTLQSSAFSDPDGDTHAASQWQVLDSTGASIIWDTGEDAVNKTSRNVPSGQLAYSTTYRWQVRYKDSRGAWSEYSTSTSFTTQPSPTVDQGLVAYFPFNGNANDESGNGHDGTARNGAAPSTDRFGTANAAFSFDGVDDYVDVPDSDVWAFGTSPFTIAFWFNFTTPQRSIFLANGEAGGNFKKWLIQYFDFGGGQLSFHINDSTAQIYPVVYTGFSPVPGHWYHFAVTRNGADYTLFLDGAPVATGSDSTPVPNASGPFTIGNGQPLETSYPFAGLMDEVRIYNRALSPSEILRLSVTQMPTLSFPHVVENGGFAFTLTGDPGRNYRIEAASDLTSSTMWIPLATLPNVTGTMQYTDVNALNLGHRFYRVVLVP